VFVLTLLLFGRRRPRRLVPIHLWTIVWRRLVGLRTLRFLLVEAAQVTVRSDPEWRSRFFHLALRRGPKSQAATHLIAQAEALVSREGSAV
jgi:hypothetical protein